MNMKATRIIIASLAGLALAVGSARADLVTSFDLDENGSKESSLTSKVDGVLFMNFAKWTVKNGHKDKDFVLTWGGLDLSGKIAKAAAADKPSFVSIEQETFLNAKERKADVAWESGGKKIEGRANTHVLSVDNEKRLGATITCEIKSGVSIEGLATRILFKSVIKDGKIEHTVENKTDAKVTVDWVGTGIKGDIEAGKSLTANRPAPNGATERKSVSSFEAAGVGLGGGTFKIPVNHFAPAGNVPAPGTLALAGLAGIVAARRRR
jgi:hypothetical protein